MDFQSRNPQRRPFNPDDIPWDRILVTAPVVIALLLVFFLTWKSVYMVEPDEQAVVLRFGKYHTTTGPGLQFKIPLVDRALKVSTRERSFQLPEEASPTGRVLSEGDTLMLTGDLNAVFVRWTIQWKVSKPQDFLFRFYRENQPDYPEEVIKTVAQTVMNQLIGDYSLEEVLTEQRQNIALLAREQTQEILDRYQCGVAIEGLQMQRSTLPRRVQPSFDAILSAQQELNKLVAEGTKMRNELLPQARAERDKLVREAEGYADRRRAEVNGEINALLARYEAYAKAPEVTRQRLYIEAMEEVLAQVESKVIIDADIRNQILPLIQLDQGGDR